MHVDPKRCSIVITGEWNPSIFVKKDWVSKNLLSELESNPEVEVTPPGYLKITYQTSDVRFTLSESKAQFNPKRATDEGFEKLEQAARKLLSRLPDTPIHAFGINFGFDEKLGGILHATLEAPDQERIKEIGATLGSVAATRRFVWDERIVNLKIESSGESVQVDLNFHHPVPDAWEAAQMLEGRVAGCREAAERLLREVYELEVV